MGARYPRSAVSARRRRLSALLRHAAVCLVLATVVVLAAQPRRAAAAPGDISTVAGTGNPFVSSGGAGDGGPALQADLIFPYGLTASGGRSYLSQSTGFGSEFDRVRVVQAGIISTAAGGADPPLNDGATATQGSLANPESVVTDAAGNVFIADSSHNRVRRVDAQTGVITTYAGASVCPTLNTCTTGPSGDGGPAIDALIDRPITLAIDAAGNLYVGTLGDYGAPGGNLVHRIDAGTGVIAIVAGGGSPADGLGDGGLATDAALSPYGIALNSAGDLYISDNDHQRVRVVDHSSHLISTVAGDGNADFGGDGGPATSAQLNQPVGIAVDGGNNLYIADSFNCRIRKVDTSGTITTFAGSGPGNLQGCGSTGDGGPATSATFSQPQTVDVDAAGNVYIDDAANNRIRKVDTGGTITAVAGNGTAGYSGDGGPATAAELSPAGDTNVGPSGNLLISDTFNGRIRSVDSNGIITTVAGGGVGDGFPATSANLNRPHGLATDAAGNLLIADCGNNRVRKVDGSTGIISSIAGASAPHGLGDGGAATSAGLDCPAGLAVAGSTLYIADSVANRVRKVDAAGVITTVAGTGTAGFSGDGGPATAAQLSEPSGLATDSAGNLYIADRDNNRVRRVDPGGKITTVAGSGGSGAGVDGIPATAASVTWPVGLAIGPGGSLTIAESGFARVRSVNAKGIISTVAGNGIPGYSGDGGPGPLATLDEPTGVAYDAGGNLLIADNQNLVIRSVAPGTPPPPPPVKKKTANCGITITQNLTLADDIGPCPGDGVIIGADGVHLNLNAHTISGNAAQAGTHVGIRATGRQRVKISNGAVTGFDAGVALIGGSGNTVTGLTVADNLGNPDPSASVFGDGIVMFFSSGNTVASNRVLDNGPFDGIAMLGSGADNNVIQNNVVKDTNNFGRWRNPGLGLGIVTNPFLGFDRPRMVSVNSNQIVGNTVTGNGSAGISTIGNVNGVVRSNLIVHNGFQGPFGFALPGNGLGVTNTQLATPNTNELVQSNQVYGNAMSGIQVGSNGNHILNNTADGNGGRFAGTSRFDLQDLHFDPVTFDATCGTNTWSGNVWGSGGVNPACTSTGGHALPSGAHLPLPLQGPVPQGLGDPPPRQMPS